MNIIKNKLEKECFNINTYRELKLIDCLQNNLNNDFKQYKLTKIEYQLILSYTAMNSFWINSELRTLGYNNCKCKNQVSNLINSGLEKIPSFKNNIVFRMEPDNIYEKSETRNWYKKNLGEIIQAPFFLSTSKEDWQNRDIILRIKTNEISCAKDLFKIGINTSEKEVLFKANSLFKIIEVNNNYIELQEINKTEKNPIFWNIKNE